MPSLFLSLSVFIAEPYRHPVVDILFDFWPLRLAAFMSARRKPAVVAAIRLFMQGFCRNPNVACFEKEFAAIIARWSLAFTTYIVPSPIIV